jgi:hypothetical protein
MNTIDRNHPAYPVVLFAALVWALVDWLVELFAAKRLAEAPPPTHPEPPAPSAIPDNRRDLLVLAKRLRIRNYSRMSTDSLRLKVAAALDAAPGSEAHTNIGQTKQHKGTTNDRPEKRTAFSDSQGANRYPASGTRRPSRNPAAHALGLAAS